MASRSFSHRAETFGLDTSAPWALPALRLLFCVPRAYQPLVDSWDVRHPGTRRALDRLVTSGFVAYQGPVVINTRTAENAETVGRRVARFRTTAKGKKLAAEMTADISVLGRHFPHARARNLKGVARLLRAFDLDDSHARFGLSAPHAVELSGLAERSGRWWVAHLEDGGYIRRLGNRLADTREVVPAHWRVTRLLANQLGDVIAGFSDSVPASLAVEFRLRRSRYLGDIDPARIGISGATDFDHDVECQRILAAMLSSPRCAAEGIFVVEPRLSLPIDQSGVPWRFAPEAEDAIFYQPDAEIRERDEHGTRRSIIEYERFQTRRDAWSHIERFLGWLATRTLPFEGAVLRFVVDSEARVRSYVALIEAFCDWSLDHTDHLPPNQATLAVSSVERVLSAADPLDPRAWFRISLPPRTAGADTGTRPLLHAPDATPYDMYFARSSSDSGASRKHRGAQ